MVEHAFITSRGPEGRDSARGFALGRVTALGPPGRDERISSTMTAPGRVSAPIENALEHYDDLDRPVAKGLPCFVSL